MGPNLGLRNLEGRHLKWNSTALPGNRFWIAGKLWTLKISHFVFLVLYVPTNRLVRQLSRELISWRFVDVHYLKQVQIYWDSFSFQKLEIITNGTGILQMPTMAQKIMNNDPQIALKPFKYWTVAQMVNYNGARILENNQWQKYKIVNPWRLSNANHGAYDLNFPVDRRIFETSVKRVDLHAIRLAQHLPRRHI